MFVFTAVAEDFCENFDLVPCHSQVGCHQQSDEVNPNCRSHTEGGVRAGGQVWSMPPLEAIHKEEILCSQPGHEWRSLEVDLSKFVLDETVFG